MTPYEQGWDCGYNNLFLPCPYPEGTEEYKEWQRGYWQGKWIDGMRDS